MAVCLTAYLIALVILLCADTVMSQVLSIPSTWMTTSANLSREAREILASDAAKDLLRQIDVSSNPVVGLLRGPQDITSIYAVLALQDYHSGNTSWNYTVINGMQAENQQHGLYGVPPAMNPDAIYWGLAFFYAYRTYQERVLLDLATEAWNLTYFAGFITPIAAASGTGAGRNVSFLPPSGCTTESLAGGVFVTKDAQNVTDVNMEAIGPFMALAAYLYEETSDPVYQQAVQLSIEFTLKHMFNGSIIADTFHLSTCELYSRPFTTNQAWFIEGLSVWANVTNNNTLNSLLETFVYNVTTFSGWSLQSGVLSEAPDPTDGDSVLKGIFIRGLTEAYMRNPGTDLARFIAAYITVQFNSLLDNARSASPNASSYSTSWYGPPVSSFSGAGNIAALDVLNAVFSFVAPSSNSSSGDPTTTTQSNFVSPTAIKHPYASMTKMRSEAIAGGTVSGATLLLAAVVTFLLCRRRQKRSRNQTEGLFIEEPDNQANEGVGNIVVEPFMLNRPAFIGPSKWQRIFESNRNQDTSSSSAIPVHLTTEHNNGARAQDTELARTVTVPNSDGVGGREISGRQPTGLAELPTLIRRLDNLLRGHHEEPPPQYEGRSTPVSAVS